VGSCAGGVTLLAILNYVLHFAGVGNILLEEVEKITVTLILKPCRNI
jgi:hypothetical protein